MSYFGFLFWFLVLPIAGLFAWWVLAHRRGARRLPGWLNGSPWVAIGLHVILAVAYTTPWDNYLVATQVWWYDPGLVSGILLGWVPIEEYTFFVLQPILGGLWLLTLLRLRTNVESAALPGARFRVRAVGLVALLWLAAVFIFVAGWMPGRYLALELGWALPPIMLQLAFGADILWKHRGVVLFAILSLTLYLSAADALAIGLGIWTIDPGQSLGVLLAGILPLEEFVFFFLTNTLIAFGISLMWARESRERMGIWRNRRFADLLGWRSSVR